MYSTIARFPRSDSAHQLSHFEGQEQCAGNKSYPLGPGTSPPQAISFCKAQRSICKRNTGSCPEVRVSHVVGVVKEDLRETAIGIDVQQRQQAFGNYPDVAMNQHQGTKAHQQDENSFKEFEKCDRPKSLSLAMVGINRVSVGAHSCWRTA